MSGSVLSHQQTFDDADRLHPLRRTESDRDLAYLIRTLLRFSAQRERGATRSTGPRTQTSGAVKRPRGSGPRRPGRCGNRRHRRRRRRNPTPADSSSLGRSTATACCPRSRSSGTTRCQSHALPPPPWISANVATIGERSGQHCRDGLAEPRLQLPMPATVYVELLTPHIEWSPMAI